MSKKNNSELLLKYSRYIFPILNFRDIVITKGKGSYIWDANGNKYLDLNSGQFCAIFGHSNKDIAKELAKISMKIQDTDTSTLSEDVLFAAKKVHDITPEMNSRVVFLSTGAEANECCLRYAKHIKEKDGIVAFDRGYHGQTHGTAAYSMSRSRIRPTIDYSYVTPAPCSFLEGDISQKEIDQCVNEFEKVVSANKENIAAAIFEPIISGGGLYFPPKYYFKKIREICDNNDIFLIFDECQTGFGRTGSWFYYQQLECIPDFVVCAKAMGLGYPVSCVIANGNTIPQESFPMQHYSSHQNEPFAANLVLYAIETIQQRKLLKSNIVLGKELLNILESLAQKNPLITQPRGKGLMCGFNLFRQEITEYESFGTDFCKRALSKGLILQHCNYGRTIRLLPNYFLKSDDLNIFFEKMCELIDEY